jgi:pimeloyl-ACP methyl ester carboxylesterase
MSKSTVGRFADEGARTAFRDAYGAASATLWASPSEEIVVDTSFGPTFVRRAGGGAGRPLVLLHPLAATGLSWHPLAKDLSEDRQILAVDTIGTAGMSDQTAPVKGPADFALWMDELIDGLDLDLPHVLGYSNGAWHAVAAALHSRRGFASLTLIEPSGVLTSVPLRTLVAFVAAGARPTAKSLGRLDTLVSPGYTVDPLEKELAALSLSSFESRLPWPRKLTDEQLRRLSLPTHVLIAGRSALCRPAEAVLRLDELVQSAQVSVFDDAGHALPFELRGPVVRSILAFLRTHDENSSAARTGRTPED